MTLISARCLQFCRWNLLWLAFGGSWGHTADLLRWDLTGTTGTNSGPLPAAPSAGVMGSSLTGGGTTGNSGSPANTWNRAFTVTEDYTQAQDAGNFFSFATSAAEGFTVSISGIAGMNLTRTSIGPTTAGLFFSTDDGATYTQTGSDFAPLTNNLTSAATAFSSTLAVAPLVIAGGQTVHWRLVVYGGSGNRLGIGNAGTTDIALTGTSVADVAVRNLLWTGVGSQNWNTVETNLNWADTGMANAPASFHTDDNVAVNTAGDITIDGGGVIAGSVVLGNPSGVLNLLGGSLSGLTLTKSGEGTASLRGVNFFPGGTSLSGGTLQWESDSALGSAPVAINNAVIQTTSDVFMISNAIDTGEQGATFHTEADVTLSGTVQSPGAANNTAHRLLKTGPGTLLFTNSSAAAFGSQMTINASGGAMELDVGTGGVIFTGGAQRNLAGTNNWDGPVVLQGGIFMLHGATVEGNGLITISGNASIRSRLNFGNAVLSNSIEVLEGTVLGLDSANGNNFLTAASVITGGGAVNKTGNGTVRMEGANDYAGMTTIEAGILRVGTGSLGRLGQGDVQINAGTLALNRSDAFTVPNAISGVGNVSVAAGNSITTLTGTNSYVGSTTVTSGILRIDGDSSAATGLITVAAGAALGGKGSSGATVVLQSGAGLAARISNWSGTAAGTDFDTLRIAALDAADFPIMVVLDRTDLVSFTETTKSFPILLAAGGITGFSPGNVTVLAPGFSGQGAWSLTQSANSLVLAYAPAAGVTYQAWAAGPSWNLSEADALPDADPDKDGIPNAVEFVIGGNPGQAPDNSKLPLATVLDTHLVVVFRRSAVSAYLNPAVQYGSNLTGWAVAEHGLAGVTIAVDPEIEPGMDELTVSIPRSLAAGPGFFARLRVVVP